jgi:hypothetical protein
MPILSADETKRRMDAYRSSRNDKVAAKKLGIPRSRFRGWRVGKRLPDKGNFRPPRIAGEEEAERLAAYNATNGDQEAATMLGIEYAAFRNWRNSRCLRNKGKWGGARTKKK